MEYDDSGIVREFIITDNLRKVVAKNVAEISESTHLFRKLFAAATQLILSEVGAEIYGLRREMSQRKLRILGEETAENALRVRYEIRSRDGNTEGKTEILREELRREIGLRVAQRMKAMESRANAAEQAKEKQNAT